MRNASKQTFAIGQPICVEVTWYDKCTIIAAEKKYEGEVIGWRNSQIIVSVKDYAVLRFWKRNGMEVGNKDHARRGFSIDVETIGRPEPAAGVSVTFSDDDGQMSDLQRDSLR